MSIDKLIEEFKRLTNCSSLPNGVDAANVKEAELEYHNLKTMCKTYRDRFVENKASAQEFEQKLNLAHVENEKLSQKLIEAGADLSRYKVRINELDKQSEERSELIDDLKDGIQKLKDSNAYLEKINQERANTIQFFQAANYNLNERVAALQREVNLQNNIKPDEKDWAMKMEKQIEELTAQVKQMEPFTKKYFEQVDTVIRLKQMNHNLVSELAQKKHPVEQCIDSGEPPVTDKLFELTKAALQGILANPEYRKVCEDASGMRMNPGMAAVEYSKRALKELNME